MRILYHAINGIGLGHLMRLSAIACAVRSNSPDVHQLFASSANYPQHFRRMAIPVIVLPSSDAGSATDLDRRSRTISSRLSTQILDDVISDYDPQVVVFDTHVGPHLVRRTVNSGRQAVLVYRRCREQIILRHLREGLLARMHRILIPHTEVQFRRNLPNSTYRHLVGLGTVRFVGPVVFPASLDVAPRLSVEPGDELVLIVGGGGGLDVVNRAIFRRACHAASELRRERPKLRCVYIGGPLANASKVPDGCLFIHEESEMQQLMARAALVIAIPGYNTVQEILHTGARTILLPMPRQQEDQEDRVAELVARGRAASLSPSAGIAEIRDTMRSVLDMPAPPPEPCPGAANAAAEILGISAAPRKLICSRDSAGFTSAVHFSSTRKLLAALRKQSETESCLRLDWDRVESLFASLRESDDSLIRSIEIVIGRCSPAEAAQRMRQLCAFFEHVGFQHDRVLFTVDDPSGGLLLRQLTQEVADLRFRALVARFSERALELDPTGVFECLEVCRKLAPGFKLDVTMDDKAFAFVDQP